MSGRDDVRKRFENTLKIRGIVNPDVVIALIVCTDWIFDESLNAGAMAPRDSRDSTIAAIRDHYYGSVGEIADAHRQAINKTVD